MTGRWRYSLKDAWSKIPDLGGTFWGEDLGLGLVGGGQIFLFAWVKGSIV